MDARTMSASSQQHSKSTSLPGYGRLPYEKASDHAVVAANATAANAAVTAKKKKQPFWSGLFRRNKPTTAVSVVAAAEAPAVPPVLNAKLVASDDSSCGDGDRAAVGQRPPGRTNANNNKTTTEQEKLERPNRLLLQPHPFRALSKDRSPGRPSLTLQDTLGPMQSELSTSQSSLGRKERREAILARALARRNGGGGGSSSDEDGIGHHQSQESLTSSNKSSARSRSGRTERYMRRRSRSDDYPLLIQQQQQPLESDSWASSPTSPRPWLVATAFTSANPSPPVTLRKFNNNNYSYSPSMNRAHSAVLTPPYQPPMQQYHVLKVPVMGTPPPPPPRNPLKKSYLLSQVIPSSQRPTSYSFGDARHSFHQQQQMKSQPNRSHDYQNVDTNGRAVASPPPPQNLTLGIPSPGQQRHRAVAAPINATSSPVTYRNAQQSMSTNRHHSAFYPSSSAPVKSPPTFRHAIESPPSSGQTKPLPWLVAKTGPSSVQSPPVSSSKDFWKAKDRQQLQPVKSTLSARERLASPFSTSGDNSNRTTPVPQQHPVRELSRLKPSTDRNLEKAICELEDIYRSLNLAGDEDLLDRAERRDLPTVHQQLILRSKLGLIAAESSACSGSEMDSGGCGGLGVTSDLDTMLNWSVSGSFESLNTTTNSSGGQPRSRAPPRRRSGVPDKVMDDMAVRRITAATRQSSQTRDHDLAAQSGSYLLLAAADERDGKRNGHADSGSSSSSSGGQASEPDVVLDDVAFRHIRTANNLGPRVPEPQPFGIPLGPVALASPTDYLHASVTPEQHALRPLLHATKYPDLVRDDLAFRNLRKDPSGQNLAHHPVNTDKLDDLLRESSTPPSSGRLGNNSTAAKKRAVRSLSANIGQLIIQDAARPSGGGGVIDFNRKNEQEQDEQDDDDDRYRIDRNPFSSGSSSGLDGRAQSLTDLMEANNNNNTKVSTPSFGVRTPRSVKHRSDLKRVTKSCEPERPSLIHGVSAVVERQTRPSASWVERAQLVDVDLENNDNDGNSSKRSTLRASSSTETLTGKDRVPALAKLYPASALLPPSPPVIDNESANNNNTTSTKTMDAMDHLISDLSQFAASADGPVKPDTAEVDRSRGKRQSKKQQLAVSKPPKGASVEPQHHIDWEESPLFHPRPQFVFCPGSATTANNNNDSASDSASSGQVSCCAREVRQILAASALPSLSHPTGRNKVNSRSRTEPELTTQAAAAADSSSLDRGATAAATTGQRRTSNGSSQHPANSAGGSASNNSARNRRMSSSTNNNDQQDQASASGAAQQADKRAERIARYKEERRKQLLQSTSRHQQQQTSSSTSAAVATTAVVVTGTERDAGSSSEELPHEHHPSYAQYKQRKQLKKQQQLVHQQQTEPQQQAIVDAVNSNVSSGSPGAPIKRFIKRDSPTVSTDDGQVRTNRAARLRAAAVAVTPPAEDKSGGQQQTKGNKRPSFGSEQATLTEGVEKDQVLLRPNNSNSRVEKDKSTKRKSNLNRALTDELTVAHPTAADSQDDAGKRIRRRARTGELNTVLSPSSAETDLSSSAMEPQTTHRPTDLRAALRKTSQPPAFIRPQTESSSSILSLEKKSPSPAAAGLTVPWRKNAASSGASSASTSPAAVIKTEELTARIEALTAIANQTVARVDRLTAPIASIAPVAPVEVNGVKAVASKLLNQAASPLPVIGVNRRPQPTKMEPVASSPSSAAVTETNDSQEPVARNSQQVPDEQLANAPADVNKSSSVVEAAAPVADSTPQRRQSLDALLTAKAVTIADQPHSILKKKLEPQGGEIDVPTASAGTQESTGNDPVSILKRPGSRNGSPTNIDRSVSPVPIDPLNSILKRGLAASSPGPGPILKKRSSTEDALASVGGPAPILKKKSISNDDEPNHQQHEPSQGNGSEKPKPILKTGLRTSVTEQQQPDIVATASTGSTASLEASEKGEEQEEPPRQLSVAERISSMERSSSTSATLSASPAPWRLPTRPGASPSTSRRKLSLEQQPPPSTLEAVSRHVASPTSSSGPVSLPNNEATASETTEEFKTEGGEETTSPERIRGILRRKSSESSADSSAVKSILRSKSPLQVDDTIRPTKSILKRPEDQCSSSDERKGKEESPSSSEEEDELVVPDENNLAAQLLNVAEKQSPARPIIPTPSPPADALSSTETQRPSRRQAATIIVESEGSSSGSGTETTTTVTFRLGGATSATTSTTSTTKAMSSKTTKTAALIEELGGASSLATRLAALQKSGESDWRKRMGTSPAAAVADEEQSGGNSDSDKSSKKNLIASRLKVLETAQLGWKARVHEPDAARFTVAGKMGHQQRPLSVHVLSSSSPLGGSANNSPTSSPSLDRKKKTPAKPIPVIRPLKTSESTESSTPDTPNVTDNIKPIFNRSTSDPMGASASGALNGTNKSQQHKVTSSRIVSIPRPDDETFTSFFTASSWSLSSSSSSVISQMISSSSTTVSVITEEDFDHIAITTPDMIVERRAVSVQRRKKNVSRNPIKSLILRPEMWREEYEEVDTGVAEREVHRIKVERLQQATNNAHLAVEALAGLAAKEDFAAVALKSAAEQRELDLLASAPHSVYLVAIKGRRQVQTRLVEPVYSSVNSGDCYVLVAPAAGHVIQFIGRYSNVIERAKCAEVAQRIFAKKDLGCGKATGVQIVDEEKGQGISGPIGRRFWKALGGDDKASALPAGLPEEDEIYESDITATNIVYRLDRDKLVPFEDCWGVPLQIEMLDPNSILVFDFGSEMYVWSGKMAPLELRKTALELARHQLWDAGYDYSECAINPIAQRVTTDPEKGGKSTQRPPWAVLKTVKQHMEPVLFQSKFTDWPHDSGQIIKVKRQESDESPSKDQCEPNFVAFDGLVPCDAQQMIDNKPEEPDLELEGCHLGRGIEYYDAEERRLHKVSSLSVKVWHLQDYEKCLVDNESSFGQFHERDTYIIRHEYRVTVTGKDLKGKPSVHGLLGRDRFVYFIWHGALAPPTDQGASALATVELDEERGPHVRVSQGHEPPAFLALFHGRMAIHCGKRGESTTKRPKWRLYVVRGELEGEAHLVEVDNIGPSALRSRGSVLLVNIAASTVYVWHGAKSLKHTRQVATAAANALQQNRPPELFTSFSNSSSPAAIAIKEQFEGAESRDFWEGIGHGSRIADRSAYHCLADSSARYDYTPRLYHLTSWSGTFRAEEVAPSCRHPSNPCAYPFLQEDIYGANQPTLFLLDDQDQVWLWQGFWPSDGPDAENASTGSSKLRWTAERRCAMETAMAYCRLKSTSDPPKAYLVSAGREPLAFTGLFPLWTPDDRVQAATSKSECGQVDQTAAVQSIEQVLDRLKRATYTLSELQVRPPPEGVDPTRLESYLNAHDFQETMGMTKADFYALPAWRQSQLRKETGLF